MYSGALKLTNLDDFLIPSKECFPLILILLILGIKPIVLPVPS